jgi:hypothetical protein
LQGFRVVKDSFLLVAPHVVPLFHLSHPLFVALVLFHGSTHNPTHTHTHTQRQKKERKNKERRRKTKERRKINNNEKITNKEKEIMSENGGGEREEKEKVGGKWVGM